MVCTCVYVRRGTVGQLSYSCSCFVPSSSHLSLLYLLPYLLGIRRGSEICYIERGGVWDCGDERKGLGRRGCRGRERQCWGKDEGWSLAQGRGNGGFLWGQGECTHHPPSTSYHVVIDLIIGHETCNGVIVRNTYFLEKQIIKEHNNKTISYLPIYKTRNRPNQVNSQSELVIQVTWVVISQSGTSISWSGRFLYKTTPSTNQHPN